ncbi:MAG: glycoside hydrolase family 26 protein [Prevotellaceae bacterium]|jgi:mannan endo-1,4-beta-mannosidase|nr:glycoside hydrolase family 26 protein [Prevotellaceae bacterium]
MMKKTVSFQLLIVNCLLLLAACVPKSKPAGEEEAVTPVLLSSAPAANATVAATLQEATLVFGQKVAITNQPKITLNGGSVAGATATDSALTVRLGALEATTAYTLSLAAGAIKAIPGVMNTEAITVAFRTAEAPPAPPLSPTLAVANPSPEAVKLYAFLKENFGQKIISGAMANVSWNTNEAEWVHRHTGKYPALNGFDYIHLYASPSSWIDYGNTQVVEDWWSNNGIVTAMWHWNVPTAQGSSTYAFYTPKGGTPSTAFDISKAVQDGTYEHGVVTADLNAIANYLLLLKQKNIPVLWRPLHEAAGGWFWWGAKGATPLKALWRLMFETFEAKGLNNLIWVWTAEPNDDAWYPGDEYVDIVGRDIYGKPTAAAMAGEYASLKTRFPSKMVTLSECGNVASVAEQAAQGVRWSWFMPWYDYGRTSSSGGAAFSSTAHEHANAAWWSSAFADPRVLSRDEIEVKD